MINAIIFAISLLVAIIAFIIFWKLYDIYFKNDKAYLKRQEVHLNYNKWQGNVHTEITKPVFPECLSILGFDDWPTDMSEIKNRFHRLAKEKHPDAGGSTQEFEKINKAYKEAQALDRYNQK